MPEEDGTAVADFSADTGNPSEVGQDEFAAEMWEGTSGEEGGSEREGAGQSGGQSADSGYDLTKASLTEINDLDQVDPSQRGMVENFRNQFSGLQTTVNEKDKAIQNLQSELDQLKQGSNQPQQAPGQQQGQQGPTTAQAGHPFGYLQQDENSPLSEAEVRGAYQVQAILQNTMQPLLPYLQFLPELVSKYQEVSGTLDSQSQAKVAEEVQSLRGSYGQKYDTSDAAMQTANSYVGLPKPGGGEHTLSSAFELINGISAEAAERIRQERAAAQQSAKGRTRPTPAASGGSVRGPVNVGERAAAAGWDS